jgi:hypothetical protein
MNMGDVTRQQVITAPQGTTMIRPIQITDQNVITMNGATAIPGGTASWQQVKTTGTQPMTTGTTTYYPQYELKVENKKTWSNDYYKSTPAYAGNHSKRYRREKYHTATSGGP